MEGYQIKSEILESLNNEIDAINTRLLDSLKEKKDVICTEEFVKMGIDELSVSPSMVLPLRKRIREIK